MRLGGGGKEGEEGGGVSRGELSVLELRRRTSGRFAIASHAHTTSHECPTICACSFQLEPYSASARLIVLTSVPLHVDAHCVSDEFHVAQL